MMLYVRGRNGAWYCNPLHIFTEGYVSFAPLELVLWLNDGIEVPDPGNILKREMQDGAELTGFSDVSKRIIPSSSPEVKMPAVGFGIALVRRIPVPSISDGYELWLTRAPKPYTVLDPPADPRDAYEKG